MLPIFSVKKASSVVRMKPSDGGPEMDLDAGLQMAAEDLIKAVHAKDVDSVAKALEAAFYICDSYPHQEGEHSEENE